MDEESEYAVGLDDSAESVQYVDTVIGSKCYYWQGYNDGVAETRLAYQRGCCPASQSQLADQEQEKIFEIAYISLYDFTGSF